MVVLDAEGATREFTTSEGATNALADAQDMAPITADDFIFGMFGLRESTKGCATFAVLLKNEASARYRERREKSTLRAPHEVISCRR